MHVVCKQARSLTIMPNDLQKIAAFSPEAEKTTVPGIALENFLHAQSQARKATPHVGGASRKPHTNARRIREHRNPRLSLNARRAPANVAADSVPVTRT